MKVSVIIPCFQSESTIQNVVNYLDISLSEEVTGSFEIILINDGSTDRTLEKIREICKTNKNVKGLNLSKNFGQPNATLAGLAFADGDIIFYCDDDVHNPPFSLRKLIDKIDEGYDVVFGKTSNNAVSKVSKIGTNLNKLMSYLLLNKPKGMHFGNLWACRRYVADQMIKNNNPSPYLGGIFTSVTLNISNIVVADQKQLKDTSSYSFSKKIVLFFDGLTAFSVKPLRIGSLLGILFSLVGFIFALITIYNKIMHPEVPAGYSSVMSGLLILGGLILLQLGLMGEYIGRIYISQNNSPQYVVKEKINFKEVD